VRSASRFRLATTGPLRDGKQMEAQSRNPRAWPHMRHDRGPNQVVIWRREQLVRSGLPLSMAARAAKNADYDLHALIELLGRHCPPELAIRILAPIESESAA
jgi:hypothetical protein